MRSFAAGANDDGMRLSRFVQRVAPNLPTPTMHKAFRNKRIKVNGKRQTPEYRILQGDEIQLYINDEFFPEKYVRKKPAVYGIGKNTPMPEYNAEFEDENIAVLYKPAGLLCHHGTGKNPTLLDIFTAGLIEKNEYNPEEENTFAPALCNRLDRGTEGLVLAAKNAQALRSMNEIIKEGLLQKEYICICVGRPQSGVFHAFLSRQRDTHRVTVTAELTEDVKPISTGIKVLAEKNGLSLCKIDLITGRTHQIRAHLAFLGTPVLGDAKYGNSAQNKAYHLQHQALCAVGVTFAKKLPDENLLAYLSGKNFSLSHSKISEIWEKV